MNSRATNSALQTPRISMVSGLKRYTVLETSCILKPTFKVVAPLQNQLYSIVSLCMGILPLRMCATLCIQHFTQQVLVNFDKNKSLARVKPGSSISHVNESTINQSTID